MRLNSKAPDAWKTPPFKGVNGNLHPPARPANVTHRLPNAPYACEIEPNRLQDHYVSDTLRKTMRGLRLHSNAPDAWVDLYPRLGPPTMSPAVCARTHARETGLTRLHDRIHVFERYPLCKTQPNTLPGSD